MEKLKKKVAIVTGSASGLGRECAISLAREGANLVVADINEAKGLETVDIINKEGKYAAFNYLNVENEDSVKVMVSEVLAEQGRIDVLINCAGIIFRKGLLNTCLDEWQKTISVNLSGLFLTVKEVIPVMLKQHQGKIINIASVAALMGSPYLSYAVAKAGVISLTKCLAYEFASEGINTNCIVPGIIESPMNQALLSDSSTRENVIKKIPGRRIGSPVDVANAVVFLASDQSDYINGETLTVDGGATKVFSFF